MEKWQCTVCEWIYDEEVEGVPFSELPEDWVCPSCGVDKSFFEKISD
ncbi:MAG: rubredoxin [Euryarchaeota archaeon]|nr:rubredoxin [Euryarchaeota archaeon]